jgi:hypothetical protein
MQSHDIGKPNYLSSRADGSQLCEPSLQAGSNLWHPLVLTPGLNSCRCCLLSFSFPARAQFLLDLSERTLVERVKADQNDKH